MPALITEIIPKQGFELVRDRILEILVLELANQKILQLDLPDYAIWLERSTPVDRSEEVTIILQLDSANYENYGERAAQGITVYNIDIYATGTSSADKHGYLDSAIKIHRFVGLCRYILSSTKYNTLGFDQGAIGNKALRNLQMYDVAGNQDTSFGRMARLALGVKIEESQLMWKGTALNGTTSQIKLELTEKGYKYELNN